MPKFRLAVQIDVEVEVAPDSDQDISPNGIRRLVWWTMSGMTKHRRREDWELPGIKTRMYTRFFAPTAKGVAEVVEVIPEMDTDSGLRPRWKLVRVAPDDDTADQAPWRPQKP